MWSNNHFFIHNIILKNYKLIFTGYLRTKNLKNDELSLNTWSSSHFLCFRFLVILSLWSKKKVTKDEKCDREIIFFDQVWLLNFNNLEVH